MHCKSLHSLACRLACPKTSISLCITPMRPRGQKKSRALLHRRPHSGPVAGTTTSTGPDPWKTYAIALGQIADRLECGGRVKRTKAIRLANIEGGIVHRLRFEETDRLHISSRKISLTKATITYILLVLFTMAAGWLTAQAGTNSLKDPAFFVGMVGCIGTAIKILKDLHGHRQYLDKLLSMSLAVHMASILLLQQPRTWNNYFTGAFRPSGLLAFGGALLETIGVMLLGQPDTKRRIFSYTDDKDLEWNLASESGKNLR